MQPAARRIPLVASPLAMITCPLSNWRTTCAMPGPSDLAINTGPVLALTAAGHLQILRGQTPQLAPYPPAIVSNARFRLLGPKAPIATITTPMLKAIKTHTPGVPALASTNAIMKLVNIVERRLNE